MQKDFNTILLFVATCQIFIGCFEPADIVFPENYEPVVVIEALLTDDDRNPFVLISNSTGPNGAATFIPVNNAEVHISDNEGRTEHLTLVEPGRYEASEIKGQVGQTYKLDVIIEGKSYSSIEKLHAINFKDSIYTKWIEEGIIYKEGHYIASKLEFFSDTIGYFKINFYKNDSLYNNYRDLKVFETQYAPTRMEVILNYTLELGDAVKIEIYSLSDPVYKYWRAHLGLTNNTFTNSSIPPINLPSNISGGALGYFQVSSVKQRRIVVE